MLVQDFVSGQVCYFMRESRPRVKTRYKTRYNVLYHHTMYVTCLFNISIKQFLTYNKSYIPVNPPPLHRSLPRKSFISHMDWVSCAGDINLPHDLPPTKKSSTIKSWPTFCDQYFWKFPIWNTSADKKRWEIRMVKVFKWYLVIDLFDTFTGKLGHGD